MRKRFPICPRLGRYGRADKARSAAIEKHRCGKLSESFRGAFPNEEATVADEAAPRPNARAEVSSANPTLSEVARLAQVSIGTASKVLNGRGQLRAETRQRVHEAAAVL